jgi:hypothetical protein
MLKSGMRIRTASMLVLVALALAVGLSACGSSSLKSAVDPVAAAAEKSAAAKTLRFSMTMNEQAPSLPAPLTLSAEGAMDYATQQASMSMDMSQMAAVSGSSLGSPSDWKIEMVMDGLVMYMKAPFMKTLLKSDKPWLKVDMNSIAKQQGLDLSSLMSYGPSEVTRYIDYLRGSKDMNVVGHELVRGVATTHYRGNVDFDSYLKALTADKQAAAKAALDKVSKPVYGPFEVWVDGQQRVRRETFSYSMNASTGNLEASFSMDFYDYDLPVSVTVPPADQTVDVMQLAGSPGTG